MVTQERKKLQQNFQQPTTIRQKFLKTTVKKLSKISTKNYKPLRKINPLPNFMCQKLKICNVYTNHY